MEQQGKTKGVKTFSLIGNIEGQTAINLITALEGAIRSNSDFSITINSHGGSIDKAFHIVHLMNELKGKGLTISTFVGSRAFSCASLIAASGTVGHRSISKYACHYMHGIDYESESTESEAICKLRSLDKQNMLKMYDDSTDNLIGNVFKDSFNEDVIIGAKKSIELGLADIIL